MIVGYWLKWSFPPTESQEGEICEESCHLGRVTQAGSETRRPLWRWREAGREGFCSDEVWLLHKTSGASGYQARRPKSGTERSLLAPQEEVPAECGGLVGNADPEGWCRSEETHLGSGGLSQGEGNTKVCFPRGDLHNCPRRVKLAVCWGDLLGVAS